MADRFILSRKGMIPVAALVFLALAGLVLPVSALNLSATQYIGSTPAGGTANYAILAGIPWGADPVDLLIEVVGIGQKPDLQYVAVEPIKDTYKYSGRKVVSVNEENVHLEPGIKKQIMLTFQLPADIGDESRYAMVVVHTIPGKAVNASDVNIPVFLTPIGSSPTMAGSITSLDAGTARAGQQATITTGYKNTGNIHQNNLVNTITINGPNGEVLGTYSGEPLSTALLPEKTFEFRVMPDNKNLPAGNYTILSKISLGSGQVIDRKTTTFTVTQDSKLPVSTTPAGSTPAVPATTKSSLPPVLGLVALAGALIILSCRRQQQK
ncbi:hypothetical protein [uncultured Methanoregula sp.]|uniref:hypothetical protein n=1 Tax=uncultured Methanoregula sp. TaxID=1005933 RepID=UPI002AAB6BB8|nr:hypothetical protein [uncultured Methanoregula sp.]